MFQLVRSYRSTNIFGKIFGNIWCWFLLFVWLSMGTTKHDNYEGRANFVNCYLFGIVYACIVLRVWRYWVNDRVANELFIKRFVFAAGCGDSHYLHRQPALPLHALPAVPRPARVAATASLPRARQRGGQHGNYPQCWRQFVHHTFEH